MEVLGQVLRLLGIFGEEAFDLDDGGEELEVFARDGFEAGQQLGVSDRRHISTLGIIIYCSE